MKQLRVLKVVVASPSDVQPERNSLKEVAEELNRGIARDRALLIELYRWETDAFPGFHVEGPQGWIDLALGIEDCDLLIGIFWKRFGKPTLDANSGTEHEFRKAYEAWKRHRRPQLMIYFKEKPYWPRTREETDQLGQVLDFKKAFPPEGLWWTYTEKPQFEKQVRNHLTQFIRTIPLPDSSQNSSDTPIKTSSQNAPPIDKQVSLWLDSKTAISNSQRTREAYETHISGFRKVLFEHGYDLDCEDENTISTLIQEWAATSKGVRKDVSPHTFNQRLSTIRSFYRFALKHRWIMKNPIEMIERLEEPVSNIEPLDPHVVQDGFRLIDRSTLLGKRDYALFYVLFTTERLVSEVTELKCGDIAKGESGVTITFKRVKGGKRIRQNLTSATASALLDYLDTVYGSEWPNDAPVWISNSRYNRGDAIGTQAVSGRCEKYFGTSKLEVIRRTAAEMRKKIGAKDIENLLQTS